MDKLKNLKRGDSVIYKNVGYGVTSYEPGEGEVIGIENGRLFTRTFDRFGLAWSEAQKCWQSDDVLGLTCYAISADDPVGLAALKEIDNDAG